MHYLTIDNFFGNAKRLRQTFDKRFQNPLTAHRDRFVWDYWHVPGEYTTLRTPAYAYFPKSLYESFHRKLVRFGREQLGCHDISPPWLSCYVDGCRQEPHQDVPHGPLAFVYSLTNWSQRKFRGGETFIIKPRTLIEPKFNRLTLFNPSLIHGVRKVTGTNDPREGRLVIHGWFVQPRPFWTGTLTVDDVQEGIDSGLASVPFQDWNMGTGLISLRIDIARSGKVTKVTQLVNTVANMTAPQKQKFLQQVFAFRFAPQKKSSRLTLPLVFS